MLTCIYLLVIFAIGMLSVLLTLFICMIVYDILYLCLYLCLPVISVQTHLLFPFYRVSILIILTRYVFNR